MNCKDFGDKDKRNNTTIKRCGTSNQKQTIPLQDRSQCINDISINFYIPSKVVKEFHFVIFVIIVIKSFASVINQLIIAITVIRRYAKTISEYLILTIFIAHSAG